MNEKVPFHLIQANKIQTHVGSHRPGSIPLNVRESDPGERQYAGSIIHKTVQTILDDLLNLQQNMQESFQFLKNEDAPNIKRDIGL